MRQNTIYYFQHDAGCGLRAAQSAASAFKSLRGEFGTHFGAIMVRHATERDVAWVRGMGGCLPDGVVHKRR
jgi:hypothetical protein